MIQHIAVGDVWAVATTGIAADLIRLGSEIAGHPSPASHVVIVHHTDPRGRWWGIEGRPGGVGYVDLAKYEHSKLFTAANSNAAQPRTMAQRKAIAGAADKLLGCGYDWVGGIAADGLDDLHAAALAEALDKWWGWHDPASPHEAPAHVVCSSYAAWVYRSLGLAAPVGAAGHAETVQPTDWWNFSAQLTPGRLS